ncbi:unnamed protein product, partial [Aphanomyces euteiches]
VERPVAPDDEEAHRKQKLASVKATLVEKVAEVKQNGILEDEANFLQDLLEKHLDVFREELANDPPIKVKPLKVHIKPHSAPVKC